MIQLICQAPQRAQELEQIAARWQLQASDDSPFALVLSEERLELRKLDEPKLGAIYVDWVEGAVAHRRKFGGGKGQSIAKAAGLNKGVTPVVLDATAGLGRDAFVLASLGCRVQMVERHPVVAALLEDGLQRAKQDDEIGAWVSERISLLHASSHDALQQLASDPNFTSPDVVYLDPMYPHPENRKKPPWSKKRCAYFSLWWGRIMMPMLCLNLRCNWRKNGLWLSGLITRRGWVIENRAWRWKPRKTGLMFM